MEKYSRWADLTTGIHPFVPHKQRFHSNVAIKALQVLGGVALCVVRVPLVAVVGLVLCLTNVIVSLLGFIPFLGRLLKRLVEGLLCTLLLWIMGVMVTTEDANTRRLGHIASKTADKSTRVAAGDLIVCNHTSVLEVLYLARRFSPVFVFGSEDFKGLVQPCGLIEAIYRACAMPITTPSSPKRLVKLCDLMQRASGPIVVFPEGARTNGKTVLQFLPLFQHLELSKKKNAALRVHLMAFRYEYVNFSPSHSAGRAWTHFFWTSCRPYHSMRVMMLHASQWKIEDLGPATQKTTTALTTAHVERMRGLLASMLRTKPVDLSVQDFVEFNAYWSHVNSGGKQPASDFTKRKAPHEHAQWKTTR